MSPIQSRIPTVLSQEEVAQLINAAPTPFYRILLMPPYATGARRAEVTRLKVSDIDSQRMVVHIQGGKGRKDRDVMLSPVLLEALREYWRRLKPKTWLFPGSRAHTAPCPITSKVIWHACHQAALRAGLHKRDRLLITEEGAVLELRTVHAQPATAPRKSVSAK